MVTHHYIRVSNNNKKHVLDVDVFFGVEHAAHDHKVNLRRAELHPVIHLEHRWENNCCRTRDDISIASMMQKDIGPPWGFSQNMKETHNANVKETLQFTCACRRIWPASYRDAGSSAPRTCNWHNTKQIMNRQKSVKLLIAHRERCMKTTSFTHKCVK